MNNKITDSFFESITSDSTVDLSVDYSELAMDTLVENPLVKELPVVKTMLGIYKAGVSIRERFLIKKMLVFIQAFNAKQISPSKLEKYRKRLKTDHKKVHKDLEHIVILIDRQTEYMKGAVLANLYFSVIEEKIDWKQFCVFASILDDLSIYDLDYFIKFYPIKAYSAFKDMDKIDYLAVARLNRNALVNFIDPTHGISVPILEDGREGDVDILKLTETGELFYSEGLRSISLDQYGLF